MKNLNENQNINFNIDKKSISRIFFMALFGLFPPFLIMAYLKIKGYKENSNANSMLEFAKTSDKRLLIALWFTIIWTCLLTATISAFLAFFIAGWFGFPFILALVLALVIAIIISTLSLIAVYDKELSFKVGFLISAIIAILAVFTIFFFLVLEGMPAIREIGFIRFIFGRTWIHDPDSPAYWGHNPNDPSIRSIYNVLPMIVGTIVAALGALIIGGGLGVLTAVCIVWFCPKKIKPFVLQAIALLAGIPSVIFGFFGMQVLLPILAAISSSGGSGPLAVAIVLGMMILPTVVSISVNSIEAVSSSYFEAGVALGASKERTVFKAVVPAAKSGIFASLILGIGRAVGETMAVIMVAGNIAQMPGGLFQPFRTLTVNIVFEMAYSEPGSLHQGALVGTGVVLLIFVLIINLIFNLIKGNKKANKNPIIMPSIKRFISKLFLRQKNKDVKDSLSFDEMISESILTKLINILPKIAKIISFVMLVFSLFFLGSMIFYVLINGLSQINWRLLTGEFTGFGRNHPITLRPAIITTLMYVLLTSIIAFPIGILTAVFLQEYAKKGSKLAKIIELALETLAGIPSIVYGLFGMILFVTVLGLGLSITSGSIVVSLMILPLTVRATQEGLKSVPDSYREGAYALGAGRVRTIFRIVLPSALPSIVTMIILGIGRMVAETASLMFTMGSSLGPAPLGYTSSGTTLAVAFYALVRIPGRENEAFAAASILILIVLALNIGATFIAKLLKKKAYAK
ncbi:MAG: phosphate ABC transporter permease subunit PstC [Erysipelotrichales bacterium]|nr:phosphate ABC transporter permease subunit PstC [Erysipelotrichales bacterium]